MANAGATEQRALTAHKTCDRAARHAARRRREDDLTARMVLALVQAIHADAPDRSAPERIGPSPVYQELEQLLAR